MQIARLCSFAPVSARALPCLPLASKYSTRSSARKPHLVLSLFSALIFTFTTVVAYTQVAIPTPEYTRIVVFGDSLSDTGNVAHQAYAKYGLRVPGPVADYTNGRFTDGYDTLPAAQLYVGVWIEQLAATIPSKPQVKNSLDGGTNYSFGFATTGSATGAFTFGPGDSLSVTVENIGQQITDYLATNSKITDKTLFVVWGGANDLIHGGGTADSIIDAGLSQTLNIQRLIDAGATQFIIPNLPPLGLVPRLNGSPVTVTLGNQASALYNSVLSSGVQLLRDFNTGKKLELTQLDIFSLFTQIVASPADFSLTNVTGSSQGMPVNPDTYLFWDDLHPTTHGHNIVALNAIKALAQTKCKTNSAEAHWCVEVAPDAVGAAR